MNTYQPQEIENKWYHFWEAEGFFTPNANTDQFAYTIVIPPPNVTGYLHIGHALVNTLQDILIRWQRMHGKKALWLPGIDHAGIATQVIVERELAKKGLKKEDLGRQKFLEEVWKHKENSGGMIFKQLRRLGASLDWSRERFTMDQGLSKAVRHTFVKLYQEGLIYRGDYLVNWCPNDQTALSDLEVIHEEQEGELTHIKYPFEDGTGFIEIATTRPETLLGDTAVAVNPHDPRYQKLIGKKLRLPLTDRLIPIIADEHCDMEFGTGAVKVTPAHDPNDFLIGQRHDLPSINIFTVDGKINDIFPLLEGEDRFVARQKIVVMLKGQGFWQSSKKHLHAVGHCQRCSTIVEPRLSTQWFCKMQAMAEAALQAVEQKQIRFIPQNQTKIFQEWLTNIQDWCLSRQIWWGHQIPAWYCQDCGAIIVTEEQVVTQCSKCSSTKIQQDPDVLDTWFSSGLFPFSTMGWPEQTQDLATFYPNNTLVTGYDILFFWVARMIMMGMKLTDQVPFPEVFLHGLIRDQNGEKMSKTKGNVINPLEIIDEYGADAFRFSLASLTVMGHDIKFNAKIVESSSHFINKIWNATKFTLYHLERLGEPGENFSNDQLGLFDVWILQQLSKTLENVDKYLTTYRFNEVTKEIYAFVWNKFCDWYLEIIKPTLFGKLGLPAQQAALKTLLYTLDQILRMLHPIMPFVTEELWQKLPGTGKTIMLASYPQAEVVDNYDNLAESIIEIVTMIRNIRGENFIKPNVKIKAVVVTNNTILQSKLQEYQTVITALANLEKLTVHNHFEKQDGWVSTPGNGFEVLVNLHGTVDFSQEIERLQKEKNKLLKKQEQLIQKQNNQNFIKNAPAAIVQKNQLELTQVEEQLMKIETNLKELEEQK